MFVGRFFFFLVLYFLCCVFVIQGTFTPLVSLVNPAKKDHYSNCAPVPDKILELLEKELTRPLVSPIKKNPIGCKSPYPKHDVSFRRELFMGLLKREELNLHCKAKVGDF